MSTSTIYLDDRLHDYLTTVSVRESDALRALREETALLPMAQMQISPEQGQFMALLVRLTGARRCLEVGTFTGYSAMACAEALPADGQLIALDVSEEWTRIARRHWQAAGLGDRIELRLGPADHAMHRMLDAGQAGTFDQVFVDADKPSYRVYCDLALALLRPGGLLLVDNVLWDGRVADPEIADEDTLAIRSLNEYLSRHPDINISLVPIGDGLTLARKREPDQG